MVDYGRVGLYFMMIMRYYEFIHCSFYLVIPVIYMSGQGGGCHWELEPIPGAHV